jgi:hypothetical protein
MRRLLALPVLALAVAPFAPAHAAETCTPTALAGVCVQTIYCTDACFFDPYVRTYCAVQNPPTALCVALNRTIHLRGGA